jgi:hypothetical protein
MRHPFDGIVTPTRRSWLAVALATLGGLLFGSRLFAAAPPTRTEDDPEPKAKPKLTQAKGESGKLTEKLNEQATTRGLREEGAMTRALNENGGPKITTLALNEEGAKK